MERRHTVAFIGIPAAGLALLAAALLSRGDPDSGKPAKPSPAAQTRGEASIYTPVKNQAAPPPAPPERIAQATETVRIRGTYQNFRRAVASNDAELQSVLLPMLLKDREAARKCANEDLARAQNDLDRAVAGRVIEALRR
jgi:hypothetical protein